MDTGHTPGTRLPIGAKVRIRSDACTEFAGREAWIRSTDEQDMGYYVRIGTADWLWFGDDELAASGEVER